MIELNEEEKEELFYDEAKKFLEQVKGVDHEARKMDKKVVFATQDLIILSLEDDLNTVYEVRNTEKPFASKLVYIGDKTLKSSYLLNLIHKQEMKIDPHYPSHY